MISCIVRPQKRSMWGMNAGVNDTPTVYAVNKTVNTLNRYSVDEFGSSKLGIPHEMSYSVLFSSRKYYSVLIGFICHLNEEITSTKRRNTHQIVHSLLGSYQNAGIVASTDRKNAILGYETIHWDEIRLETDENYLNERLFLVSNLFTINCMLLLTFVA
jgi:hypothetical protein